MGNIRKAVVAGQFYPKDKRELKEEVESYLKKGQGSKKILGAIGAIVPHAGYDFSGKCAGKVYSILPKADTFVILGTAHSTIGARISISLEDFETPLGVAKNNILFSKEILNQLGRKEDNELHRWEHSIEVQIPFLQVSRENNRDFKIVPILIGEFDLESCKLLAKAIEKAAEKLKCKIIVLASSDFTHSGPSYGSIIDMAIDKKAISKIKELDSKGFLQIAEQTTICGTGAICTVIEFCKLQGDKEEAKKKIKAELLDYYDSSLIMPNENKVGYAGIVFSR